MVDHKSILLLEQYFETKHRQLGYLLHLSLEGSSNLAFCKCIIRFYFSFAIPERALIF